MRASLYIMIDGIDGSGKDTVADAWKAYLVDQGNALFDVRQYWKQHGAYPAFDELHAYDFIFTSEPTYVGIGRVIRDELIRNGARYPERAIAEAYSLDRLVHYEKIIIPALRDGKYIIQVRGISTSLCYQTIGDVLNLEEISAMPGNQTALAHRPDHLVLMDLDPAEALTRLSGRSSKTDDSSFEKRSFLEKAARRFHDEPYRAVFESRGTTIHYLPAGQDIATMKAASLNLFRQLINS